MTLWASRHRTLTETGIVLKGYWYTTDQPISIYTKQFEADKSLLFKKEETTVLYSLYSKYYPTAFLIDKGSGKMLK